MFWKKDTSNFISVLYVITHADFSVEIQDFEVNDQYSPMVQIESLVLPFCLTAQTGTVDTQQQIHLCSACGAGFTLNVGNHLK